MNYLAHLYLSGESDEIMLGNFIADFVKGNKHKKYPEKVSLGIQIHRGIDTFTDQHPDVKIFNQILYPGYGRYSGIVTDVFMDHFLAANWPDYSIYTLRQFSKHTHAVFLSNFMMLPLKVKQFLPFLIQHKRFESYARRETMFDVLEIMSRRSSLPANSDWAMKILNKEYEQMEFLFRNFFPQIISFVETEYDIAIRKTE